MRESTGRLAACLACALWVGCGGDALQNPVAPGTSSPAMQASAGTPADASGMTAKPMDALDVAAKPEAPASPATPTSGVKPAAPPAAQPAQPSAAGTPQ